MCTQGQNTYKTARFLYMKSDKMTNRLSWTLQGAWKGSQQLKDEQSQTTNFLHLHRIPHLQVPPHTHHFYDNHFCDLSCVSYGGFRCQTREWIQAEP